jgi:hypothetical protein
MILNIIKNIFQYLRLVYQIAINYWKDSHLNELNPIEMCGSYPLSFFANNMTTFDLYIFAKNVNNHCSNHTYFGNKYNKFNDQIYNYNQFHNQRNKMKLTIRRRISIYNNNMNIIFYLSLISNNNEIIDKRECHINSINSFSIDNYNDTKFKMSFKNSMSDVHSNYTTFITLYEIIMNDLSLFYDNINNWLQVHGWFNNI